MNTGDVLPTTLSGQIPSSLPPFGDQWGRPLPTTTVTSVPSSSAYEPGCGFMTPQVSVSIIPYSHPLPLWNIPTPTSDMATGKSYRYFNICRMCLKKKVVVLEVGPWLPGQSHFSGISFGTSGGSVDISMAPATRPGYQSWTVNTEGWFFYARRNGMFH